ncbi:MAG: hypothetical protein HYW47_00660 [Deltaproteobacteria bacterium]|nr:hypothetical protein [Deltaproteobacteria bacterium]
MEKFHLNILLDKTTYKKLTRKTKTPHAFVEALVNESLDLKQCPTCGHKLKISKTKSKKRK